MTIYVDFDNTIVESNQKVIDILNKKYKTTKTEKDLKDYNFNSIAPISIEEKLNIFEDDAFFTDLKIKENFLNVLDKYYDKLEFVIVSKGTEANLIKKQKWIKENIPYDIKFIGITNNSLSKKKVNMCGGFQIDDCTKALDTNAEIKILYKNYNNFAWQLGYSNKEILVVNDWSEIDDIISFYSIYHYKTLKKR